MKNSGFTLVELALSLSVIAVVAGAIISGQILIHNAKLKVIITEARTYHQAFDNFVDKFRYLPGDFPDGGQYWGDDCEGATGGTDLCSGEGDFSIDHAGDDALTGTSESLVVWKHFKRAEMITDNYSGLEGTGGSCAGADNCVRVGQNVPGTQWQDGVGYYFITGNSSRTALFLGKENGDGWNSASHMKPVDAQYIDDKVDDGDPVAGYFRASGIAGKTLTNSGTCLDGGTTYNLDNTSEHCGAVFIVHGAQ